MANFSKEKNREMCNTLREEQHEVLEWLCLVRQKIYWNEEDLFFTESSNFNEFSSWIMIGISERLFDAELPPLVFSFDPLEWPDDTWRSYNECTDEAWEKLFDVLRDESHEYAKRFDADVELYLASIDEQYDTEYCLK